MGNMMTVYVFDAHGSIESRDDKFSIPDGVTLVIFGLPSAAIAEEIPDEIYRERHRLYNDPAAFISSIGIRVVGRESKGLKTSDKPSVNYPDSAITIAGPREIPNLVLTGDQNLSGSGVYMNGPSGHTVHNHLGTGQTLSLREAFAPPVPRFVLNHGDWIIWACCLSVHFDGPITRHNVSGLGNSGSGTGTGGTAYGFKSMLA